MNSVLAMDCRLPVGFYAGEIEAMRRSPFRSTYEWARANMRVVAGPYKGKVWDPDMSPYAKAIMDLYDQPQLRELIIVGPSQTTKTTIMYACLLADLDRRLFSCGILMPDWKSAQRIFKSRVAPHIASIPSLRRKLADSRHALEGLEIEWADHSMLYGMWSGSDSIMSSQTMRAAGVDEEDVAQDPDSVAKIRERLTIYERLGDSKLLRCSKVRGLEGESSIARAAADADALFGWHARCPVCHTLQRMELERIRVPADVRDPNEIERRELARHQCINCDYPWNDVARDKALRAGELVLERGSERPRSAAVIIRGWETVLIGQSTVLAEYFRSQGDPKKLRNFDNNYRSAESRMVVHKAKDELFRKRVADGQDGRPLHRARTVPAEALALTCMIDVQAVGFWFVVRSWSRDLTSWLVDYGFLAGWPQVEELLATLYPVVGQEDTFAPIWRAAIDIGGAAQGDRVDPVTGEVLEMDEGAKWSKTDEIKAWLRDPAGGGRFEIYATKGASREMHTDVKHSVIDVDPANKGPFSEKMVMYLMDVNALKDRYHYSFREGSTSPATWLHAEVGQDYLRQVSAEQKKLVKGKLVWVQTGGDNHLLDCEVGARACALPDWTPSLQMLPGPFVIVKRDGEESQESKARPAKRRLW